MGRSTWKLNTSTTHDRPAGGLAVSPQASCSPTLSHTLICKRTTTISKDGLFKKREAGSWHRSTADLYRVTDTEQLTLKTGKCPRVLEEPGGNPTGRDWGTPQVSP